MKYGLEWKKIVVDGRDVECVTDLGTYTISRDDPLVGGSCYLWLAGADVDDYQEFGSIGEAKERAYEDYCERLNARND